MGRYVIFKDVTSYSLGPREYDYYGTWEGDRRELEKRIEKYNKFLRFSSNSPKGKLVYKEEETDCFLDKPIYAEIIAYGYDDKKNLKFSSNISDNHNLGLDPKDTVEVNKKLKTISFLIELKTNETIDDFNARVERILKELVRYLESK